MLAPTSNVGAFAITAPLSRIRLPPLETVVLLICRY